MDAQKISLKFFVQDPSRLTGHEFVPIFHSWIQSHAVPDHLLVDVADYQHVASGPGTVLVSHEANFYTDRADNRLGLLYSRKQPLPGPFPDRLRSIFTATLQACARLEEHPALRGKIKFRTNEILLRIHDRLLAPNTPDTFSAIKPDLEHLLPDLFAGASFSLEHRLSPSSLFEVRIKVSESPDVATLLNRLHAPV